MRADELINAIFGMIKDKGSNVPSDSTTKRLKPVKIKNQKGAAQSNSHAAQKECDGQQTMTFPLQQKLELDKKVVDVPSHFDGQEKGEISDIKKLAGLSSHNEGPFGN